MNNPDNKKIIGSVLTNDENSVPLCDFEKFYSAVLTCDEQAATNWYKNEYCHSCFVVSSQDGLRMLKNGFIVLIGYMRSAVNSINKNSSVILMESTYVRAVENCANADNVYRLFVMAFRDFSSKLTEQTTVKYANNELSKCTDYIMTNLKSQLTLSDIALHCGYNPSYLSRKFKQIYGLSLKQYILSERLKAAEALLRFTDKSIAEIASTFKFSSQSHFQQEFKKNLNMTPLQYRLRCKANL